MTFPKGASYDICSGCFRLLADSQMRAGKKRLLANNTAEDRINMLGVFAARPQALESQEGKDHTSCVHTLCLVFQGLVFSDVNNQNVI